MSSRVIQVQSRERGPNFPLGGRKGRMLFRVYQDAPSMHGGLQLLSCTSGASCTSALFMLSLHCSSSPNEVFTSSSLMN